MTIDKPALERTIDRLREPFASFIKAQTTTSGFLLLALFAALALANSPLADHYEAIRHFRIGMVFGSQEVSWSALHLVNDGLIALFFVLLGLEVKRELLAGELKDRQRVRLLLAAALGGMVVPASLYVLIHLGMGGDQVQGWGIPMATDTALAIAVLAALGARVPRTAVAFLVGVAIIDDIGAIIVIAVVYTEQVSLPALAASALLFSVLMTFNRAGLRHPVIYALAGVMLWIAIVRSGVHASIAGVVVAITVPARPRIAPESLKRKVHGAVDDMPDDAPPEAVLGEGKTHRKIAKLESLAQVATTPLRRWEDGLELPVALIVLPLFVFMNAGLPVDSDGLAQILTDPVGLGVVVALIVGKPAGLLTGIFIAERCGWATRPEALSWRRLFGIGALAGIGFTMSTFIANLAFDPASPALAVAKLSIMAASTIAAIAGYCALRFDRSDADADTA
ncbi:Na+/H+ antiporter NhaA [Denitromonas halophila]|uniref:Na(+)/H(+) antiporter NhaA n=1 Tax=Denitromonas halophila TaxID=1629404 RepID=A0A557R2B6_9RHOO|nr:Na+/H+ antiporter NhaA [Denitromonas halophila]TVO59301.1 Na+/H+ antiporter NhaA [Denitromonas halophila]